MIPGRYVKVGAQIDVGPEGKPMGMGEPRSKSSALRAKTSGIRVSAVAAIFSLLSSMPGSDISAQASRYHSGPVAALGDASLELRVERSRDHVTVSIDVFVPVTLGFESPAGTVEAARAELGPADPSWADSLRFAVEIGGREWSFRGVRMRDVIDGRLSSAEQSGPSWALRLMADDGRSRQHELLGQYRGEEGRTFILTYREFGQYRWIDVATSVSTTLFSVEEDVLMSAESVQDQDDDETRYRFLRHDGRVVAAVIDAERGRTTTFERIEGLREELLTIPTAVGPTRASLLLPAGEGPHPAAVFVAGSGPIYRTALTARAAVFQEAGVAVLVYDKRGTGTFGGEWDDPSIEALAADLEAVFETIREHPSIDPSRLGFAGHSNAGYVIPEAIANGADPAFAILVSSSGRRPAEQTRFDKANDMIEAGFSEAQRDTALALLTRVQRYVLSRGEREDWGSLNVDFVRAQREPWFDVLDLPRVDPMPSWRSHPELLEGFREELQFDPLENAPALTMPVMFLNGSEDTTSDAVLSQRAWAEALSGVNDQVHMVLVQGAEHGLRDQNGVYVPEYMSSQLDWLRAIGILQR